jgi:hypothetical protein
MMNICYGYRGCLKGENSSGQKNRTYMTLKVTLALPGSDVAPLFSGPW